MPPFFNVVKTFMGVEKDNAKLREACLPSTHYAMPEGGFQLNEQEKRITSLSEIPSPYLSGKLDQFFLHISKDFLFFLFLTQL